MMFCRSTPPRKSVGITLKQIPLESQKENFDIEPQTPISNVVKVVRHALRDRRIATPAVHLSPTGYSTFYVVARHVLRNLLPEFLQEERTFGPRPNDAHVTLQHIQKLRKLIQTRAP